MMKCIVKFYENCMKIISESSKSEKKISMGFIEQSLKYNVIDKLYNMKFLDPLTPDLEIRQYFDDIVTEIENEFRKM
jgi:V-type H+-transporting ATPase subunit A|tara:strand:- start:208 stop:438 length:231 start_codon:yes stop_codon:yes gene_type:complete